MIPTFRSTPSELFLGKDVLKICSKFTGEQPCRNVIPIKFQSKFIEITLQYGCSPVNLLHIFRTLFDKNTYGGLLCNIVDFESSVSVTTADITRTAAVIREYRLLQGSSSDKRI